MAGSYDCVITDTLVAGLAVTSETAQIDVQDPIVITTQPEGDNNLYVGETFRMEVAAQGGYPPLTYQWKWNNLNLVGRTTPVYETTALSGFLWCIYLPDLRCPSRCASHQMQLPYEYWRWVRFANIHRGGVTM